MPPAIDGHRIVALSVVPKEEWSLVGILAAVRRRETDGGLPFHWNILQDVLEGAGAKRVRFASMGGGIDGPQFTDIRLVFPSCVEGPKTTRRYVQFNLPHIQEPGCPSQRL